MRSKPRQSPTPSETDSRAPSTKRRGFLLTLGAGGIGAAAMAARSLSGVAPAATSTGAEVPSGEGYRVTDHVRRYYQTAKT
jgi:hypothetical protein